MNYHVVGNPIRYLGIIFVDFLGDFGCFPLLTIIYGDVGVSTSPGICNISYHIISYINICIYYIGISDSKRGLKLSDVLKMLMMTMFFIFASNIGGKTISCKPSHTSFTKPS